MKPEYAKWIAENVPNTGYGLCHSVCESMRIWFPHLNLVRGHYYCPLWGQRSHWWLIDADETIVDPTAQQFPSNGSGEYVPWVEGSKEPTGKCMNCGEYCYDDKSTCSEECERDLVAYYGRICNP